MSSSYAPSASIGPNLFICNSRRLFSKRIYSHERKDGITRRNLASKGLAVSVFCSLVNADPVRGMERLPFNPEGYKYWTWKGRKIHYVEQGNGRPIVLIHGFGASAFHWRYNIPELAKKYKVYAVDLLGFGWSEKALIDYDAIVWRDQVSDFMREVVKEAAILVGNSLGGFTALFVAAEMPQQILGVALLNSAGQFGKRNEQTKNNDEETVLTKYAVKPLKEAFQRVVLGFLFWQAKQPKRIESVLKSVYINTSNVDDYLVESITKPASDPNAGEVYYSDTVREGKVDVIVEIRGGPASREVGVIETVIFSLMTRFMSNQTKYTLDSLLSKLSCPLLLVWGDLDPWVGPAKALQIKEFYPRTSVVNLQAGHCPHDEVPGLVNKALLNWLASLELEASLQAL